MIRFSKVSKKFGDTSLFSNLSFEIEKGEKVSIIGHSGVGKSTLLHMILGAENISDGQIEVFGQYPTQITGSKLQLYRQNIGMIFQDFKLLSDRTVYENISFILESLGRPKQEIKEKTMNVINQFSLDHVQDLKPNNLSGGESQRVSIARALVHEPQILLADEPTGNLDPENTLAIAKILSELNKKKGVTTIITTHNPSLVKSLKSRILLLEDGEIVHDLKEGTVFPNYNQPL